MSREKKDAKILSIKMRRDVHELMEEFCEETGQTKTVAVERFVMRGLNEYFAIPKEERKKRFSLKE